MFNQRRRSSSHLGALPALLLIGVLIGVVRTPAQVGGPAFTRLFAPAETTQTSYLNPAGMVRLDDPAFTGQLIYGESFSSFNVDNSRTTNTGGDPRDEDPVLVPSLYYVRPIFDDNWRLGPGDRVHLPRGAAQVAFLET